MRLLSVDFDAFFPTPQGSESQDVGSWLYDWGGLDSQVPVMDMIWTARAANFEAAGLALPGTSGEERSFWDRLTLSPAASCCFADSHSYAAVLPELVHVDAHHDGGYPGSQTCAVSTSWGHPHRCGCLTTATCGVRRGLAGSWAGRADTRVRLAHPGAVIHLQNEVGPGLKTPVIPNCVSPPPSSSP